MKTFGFKRLAGLMLAAESYDASPDADEALREYLKRRMRRPRFAHARSVRNALERARLRQANRLYEAARDGHSPTVEELTPYAGARQVCVAMRALTR